MNAKLDSTTDRQLIDEIWQCIRAEANNESAKEPFLASHLHATVLNHSEFHQALSFHLSGLLGSATASALSLSEVFSECYTSNLSLVVAAAADVAAIRDRDSACAECGTPFLYYKGFHALQTYRIAHQLWLNGRKELALFLQSRSSQCFGVDIHPAAVIGNGLMLDHATGIVIGETSVVGDNVSIMQSVTLGGTGKDSGDRHPKIGAGVLIGAGSKILGNLKIGEGTQICAGSVVLKDVAAHTVVAGVPAVAIGTPNDDMPSLTMNQYLNNAQT
jgi:serine O-acetyltransferase